MVQFLKSSENGIFRYSEGDSGMISMDDIVLLLKQQVTLLGATKITEGTFVFEDFCLKLTIFVIDSVDYAGYNGYLMEILRFLRCYLRSGNH